MISRSPVAGRYDQADRSRVRPTRCCKRKAAQQAAPAAGRRAEAERRPMPRPGRLARGGSAARGARGSGGHGRQTVVEAMVKSVARSIGTQLGRQLVRGVLGSLAQALSREPRRDGVPTAPWSWPRPGAPPDRGRTGRGVRDGDGDVDGRLWCC